jgi:hypothetical protein
VGNRRGDISLSANACYFYLRVPLGLILLSHRLGLCRGPSSPPPATPPPPYRRPIRHPPRPRPACLRAPRCPALSKLRWSSAAPAFPLSPANGGLFSGADMPPPPTLRSIASSASIAASRAVGGSAAHPRQAAIMRKEEDEVTKGTTCARILMHPLNGRYYLALSYFSVYLEIAEPFM